MAEPSEDELAFTVSTVWREERVSCPHPDLLQTYVAGSLAAGAADFIAFHLKESQCPYCNAVLEDLVARDRDAAKPQLQDLRERLMRSTRLALNERRRGS